MEINPVPRELESVLKSERVLHMTAILGVESWHESNRQSRTTETFKFMGHREYI